MKILLFGKGGQVGWELQRSLAPLGEIIALDHDSTNLCGNFTDLAGIAATVRQLAPDVIVNALADKALPVYGDGQQIRDWLYVKDHCSAIRRVLADGRLGETYNVGGWNEKPNLDIVHAVCALLDELRPRTDGRPYREQITYVTDRPGHDRRYAIDAGKLERELGWKPAETFESGIRKTVIWYLDNQPWVVNVLSGGYRDWVAKQYGA